MSEGTWYARPVFFTRDVQSLLHHYVDVFGFEEAWRHERDGRVIAAQVNRAGCEVIFNDPGDRDGGGGRLFLSLDRGQSQRYADELRAAGADVSTGHWGMPVVILRDPDGNELLLHDDELGEADP
jgi:uncharacterized glyoxalase superfamily protein PhnB